jgi:steroid delta-isomerase-like uncharacterized protein
MAEQDNIALAEKQVAALNDRDFDLYVSRLDEGYVGVSEMAPGPIQGREGARQNIERILTAFPDLRLEIQKIVASGDTVVVTMRSTGTHTGNFAGIAPTNKRFVMEACNVVEIRDGKTIRGRLYADTLSLFRQLGVVALPQAATAG